MLFKGPVAKNIAWDAAATEGHSRLLKRLWNAIISEIEVADDYTAVVFKPRDVTAAVHHAIEAVTAAIDENRRYNCMF